MMLEFYLFLTLVVLIQAKVYDRSNHISLAHNLCILQSSSALSPLPKKPSRW